VENVDKGVAREGGTHKALLNDEKPSKMDDDE